MGTIRPLRRHPRFRALVRVVLHHSRREHTGVTQDVSDSGIYVITQAPPPIGHLIRIDIPMPDGAEPLRMTGVTHRIVEVASGRHLPGAGIEWFAVGTLQREQWLKFLSWLRARPARSETA